MNIQINILTSRKTSSRIIFQKDTWIKGLKHCDVLFYADYQDEENNVIKLTDDPTRNGNAEKSANMFKFLKDNNTHDWYFFVDDDTFVCERNLLNFVKQADPNNIYGTGCIAKEWKIPFPQGGSGFLLSKTIINQIKYETIKPFSTYSDVTAGNIIRENNISTVYMDSQLSPFIKNNILFSKHIITDEQLQSLRNKITFHYIKTREDFERYNAFFNDQI